MDLDLNVFITAVATVLAGAIGGGLAWLSACDGSRFAAAVEANRALKVRLRKALAQVEAYHALEGLYAGELELVCAGRSRALAIKTEFRSRVETAGLARPTMTAAEARAALAELESGSGK